MTDSPRRDGPDPAQQPPYGYPGYTDPAYANPPLFGNHYQSPADANSTQQLPAYWQQGGYDPSQTDQFGQPWTGGAPPPPPEEPGGPGSRLWLWALAGLAVVLVIGMVTALVIVNSSQQQTVLAPPIEPTLGTTTTPGTTTSRIPEPVPSAPETTTPPSESSTTPGTSEEVVYNVSGPGRAINITYIDDGGVLQTEFNVMLPWSKTVELSEPANRSASVSIINVGREISCTITVGGSQISQKSGSGLTVCSALG